MREGKVALDDSVLVGIRKIVGEVDTRAGSGGGSIADDVELIESGIIDSLGIVELIAGIETEFGIRLAQSQVLALDFTTINRLASSLGPILENHSK